MINAKALYNVLLNDPSIVEVVGEDKILNAYPDSVENFPCIIYLDENQADIEYADNFALGTECNVTVHIFTKKLVGYPTSTEIAIAVSNVMNENYWHCSMNSEVSDSVQDVEHRVMKFNKSILC